MKKNAPLLLGGIILLAILSLIVFPDRFTHLNPYGTQGVESWVENEQFMMSAPPFAPGQGSPLGTDDQGRCLKSYYLRHETNHAHERFGGPGSVFGGNTTGLISGFWQLCGKDNT